MTKITVPYGAWVSPVSVELVTETAIGLSSLCVDGQDLYWLEARPSENGRTVLCRRRQDGEIEDLTPPPFNVGSRVHEYGGGAYAVAAGVVVVSERTDGSVWLIEAGSPPRRFETPEGCGYADFSRLNPRVIYCALKGFLSGPYEHRPALDEVVQMMSGLAAMTGTVAKPQRVGSSANDIMGGMFGAISILAALYQRRGAKAAEKGADIRIGLFENCLFLVAQHMVEYEMTGNRPRSMPEREHAWPIYDIFETKGGERIFIGVVTEGHWQSFCREFGMTEFLDDPTLRTTTDRILARSRIIPRAAEVIKGWNAAELSARLDRLNICFSPINRPEDLFSDPHVLRPGGLVNNFNANGAPFRVPALPIEWNGANIGEGLRVPDLGADTAAVRAELEQELSSTGKPAARLA